MVISRSNQGSPSPDASGPEFRSDLVVRVRREIQQGTYETPEKLEAALERMLASLDGRDDDSPAQPRP